MKALVTGGAGFIGSNLCGELVRLGWDVVVLDNLSSGFDQNLVHLSKVELVSGDVRDADAVQRAIAKCDVVFHLAACVGNRRSIEHPLLDADVNVLGTIQVLEAARKSGVRKIIVSSSAAIFGELRELPITENHPVHPDSPYGASKLCAEKTSLAYAKLFDMEVICLRYFNVYGPNQRFDAYGNVIPIFVFSVLRGEPITIFGDGEQRRDFVNVRDVTNANIMAAIGSGVSGAFNIGTGTSITIGQLVAGLQETFKYEFPVVYGPPRAGDVRDSVADISNARKFIGYNPETDLKSGLKEYVEWARTVA